MTVICFIGFLSKVQPQNWGKATPKCISLINYFKD
nr:MAG TPA: hypothetical protein [Caudoviricetes sp.]